MDPRAFLHPALVRLPLVQPPSPFKDVDVALLEAHAFYDARLYTKAKTSLAEAMRLWHEYDEASITLKVLFYQKLFKGLISFASGDLEKAEGDLQDAVKDAEDANKSDPDSPLAYLWLGDVQYSLLQYKDAIATFLTGEEKSVQLTGSTSLLSRTMSHNLYAVLLADLQFTARNDKFISCSVKEDIGTMMEPPQVQQAGTKWDALPSIRAQLSAASAAIQSLTGSSTLSHISKCNTDIAEALGEYIVNPDAPIGHELNAMLDAFLLQVPPREDPKKTKKKKKAKKGKKKAGKKK